MFMWPLWSIHSGLTRSRYPSNGAGMAWIRGLDHTGGRAPAAKPPAEREERKDGEGRGTTTRRDETAPEPDVSTEERAQHAPGTPGGAHGSDHRPPLIRQQLGE